MRRPTTRYATYIRPTAARFRAPSRSCWTATPSTTPATPARVASAGLSCMVTGCPEPVGCASVSSALRTTGEEEHGDADPPDVPEQAEAIVGERRAHQTGG